MKYENVGGKKEKNGESSRGSTLPTNLHQVNHRLDCCSETEAPFAAKQMCKQVLESLVQPR